MGMSLSFTSGIPDGYAVVQSHRAQLTELVNKYSGHTDWVYASDDNFIKAPELAEDPTVIPVYINLQTNPPDRRHHKIIVLAEKHVNVLLTKQHNVVIPNRNGQIPLDLKLETTTAATTISVATYTLANYPISRLSIRLALPDVDMARLVVLLVPIDKSSPVKVIRQKKPIRIGLACERVIYVDGPLPRGTRRGFYYF